MASPSNRILLDARKLMHGGIGTYIVNIIKAFEEEQGDLQLELLVNQKLSCYPNMRQHITSASPYSLRELFVLGPYINSLKIDLFHTPHYVLPFFLQCVPVITVHDVIHITHPDTFYHAHIAKLLIRSALSRASGVLTVSNHSMKELNQLSTHKFAEKIVLIQNAVRDVAITTPVDGISSDYLLVVTSMDRAHKGVDDLLSAYELCKQRGATFRLVIVGINRLKAPSGVQFLGSVSNQELQSLYQDARALVVPSRAEGFCLPVIEAKAYGLRVCIRPVPAIMELVTKDDTVASDFEIDSLAAAMQQVYAALPSRVSSDLSRFTIKRFATELLSFYRKLLCHTKK